MQHGELRSCCGSRFVNFVLCIFIDFKDTFETRESFLILFNLVYFTYSKWNSDSRTKRSNWEWHLQCTCQLQLMTDRDDLMITKPRKNPKPTKTNPKRQCDQLCSENPEWLQEFREILVDNEIPAHGDSHASSSHDASLEPVFKRREDLEKHSVYTHFPKDRSCEICQRTKITRAHAEDAMAKPFLVLKNLVTW